MNRHRAQSVTALAAVLCLCGCAGSMRAKYEEHLTTVIKPAQPSDTDGFRERQAPPTALSIVSDY